MLVLRSEIMLFEESAPARYTVTPGLQKAYFDHGRDWDWSGCRASTLGVPRICHDSILHVYMMKLGAQ